MTTDALLKLFDELYEDVGGYKVSLEGRRKLGFHDSAFTYGEVEPEEFIQIINKASPRTGEIFYDLGSGTGKAVILASMFFDFARAIGIEYVHGLHYTALEVLKKYRQAAGKNNVEFIQRDFLEHSFSDADIVFAHATCFHEGMMQLLSSKLESLKKGARVITVSKSVDSPLFTLIANRDYQFTWGKATVLTYLKAE